MYKIGIIGCGSRMSSLVFQLIKLDGMEIAAVADPKVDEMREKFAAHGLSPRLYPDAESMLAAETLDGIMIGTRCSLHTPMALLAAKANVPIFLEKPVSTSYKQIEALRALEPISDRVVVSFPLRRSLVVDAVKEVLDSGVIGRVRHVEAWNNVYYGRGYYKKWYRDEGETGGLFPQKATHDFDYINYLLSGETPVRVCAMMSKLVFKGDMPAGQTCSTCPKVDECPESPKNLELAGEPKNGDFCCFAVDTGNEDSSSALIEYESGMHTAYTQNFIVRKTMGERGARFIGYYGSVELDLNRNEYRVVKHFEKYDEKFSVAASGVHSGGDIRLLENFANVVRGLEKSKTPLVDGIASAKLCLCARESAEKRIFVEV